MEHGKSPGRVPKTPQNVPRGTPAAGIGVDLHHVRLMALLNELVREHGQRGTHRSSGSIERRCGGSMGRGDLWDRRGEGTRLEQAACRMRIMELEIAMLGEHGLTLPPETEPLHPSRRAVQLDWRMREIEDLRAERRRLELLDRLRRTLTFGLWRR